MLSDPEKATVAEVLDGETLKLSDGRIVRLIAAKAPAPPLGWRGDDPWPLVEESKLALDKFTSNKQVELKFGGRRSDRYDHLLAQVFVVGNDKPIWLQEELVSEGLARVYSLSDNRACIGALLAREREARAKHLGVWGSSAYRIESADNVERLGRLTQSSQLVEGKGAKVEEGGGRIYLNFADDWRSDFTISIERKDVQAFAASGIDLKGLPASTCACAAGSSGATGRWLPRPIPSSLSCCRPQLPHCSVKTLTHSCHGPAWPGDPVAPAFTGFPLSRE